MARQGTRWWSAVPIGHLDEERYLALTLGSRGVLADLYRVADREGRFHAGRRALARALGLAQVCGADSAVAELVEARFVELYDVSGVDYGLIVGYAEMFTGGHWDRRAPSSIPPMPSETGGTVDRDGDSGPPPTSSGPTPEPVPTRVLTEQKTSLSGCRNARARDSIRGPLIESPNDGQTLADKRAALATMTKRSATGGTGA